jgi:hypothetical protein
MWLCRPDVDSSYCREQQTATVYAADGTSRVEELPKAADPAIDCFYVYPTVALSGGPGNVPDFSNINEILVPLRAQAMPFTEVCEMYAPLYHQVTFSTFTAPEREERLMTAYADVEAAFDVYLKHYNRGRKFVLLGHSQGSMMLRRLLQDRFDADASLRSRLIVAMPIGPVNDVTAPPGEVVGGSFQNVPLCTAITQQGCVVAYDSDTVAGGRTIAPPAANAVCTNPASLTGDVTRLRASYFPSRSIAGQFGATTAPDLPTSFAAFPDLFSGQCARDANNLLAFRISYTPNAGDMRANPINFDTQLFHLVDYNFALRDLIELVKAKQAAN